MAFFDDDHNLALYHLEKDGVELQGLTPNVIPARLGSGFLSIQVLNKHMHTDSRDCDGALVLSFDVDEEPLVIQLTPQEHGVDLNEAHLALGVTDRCVYHSLCPTVGRLVFITGEFDVYVVDYLH